MAILTRALMINKAFTTMQQSASNSLEKSGTIQVPEQQASQGKIAVQGLMVGVATATTAIVVAEYWHRENIQAIRSGDSILQLELKRNKRQFQRGMTNVASAMSGAVVGAKIGTAIVPGLGTGVGAVVGATAGFAISAGLQANEDRKTIEINRAEIARDNLSARFNAQQTLTFYDRR